jgi:hypothetical protein
MKMKGWCNHLHDEMQYFHQISSFSDATWILLPKSSFVDIFCIYVVCKSVVTLALGSRPRQGVTRLRVKRKTQKSHHMFPRVQRV